MKKLAILSLLLLLFLLPNAFAERGHMKLLAVKESGDGSYEGGIADLYLEIRPGSGRVFLETFPLSKTDTQMSTRFAKAIACDLVEKDCDDTDFFYTISSDSAIIAGPSAGASIAVLTVAMLENLDLNDDYAITGTINSGGLIGPVGGLKAKIEAAKKIGLRKVFIPSGELVVRIENESVDLRNLSRQLGLEIAEVSALSEAVRHFTGKELQRNFERIDISEEYASTMKSLARGLCDRSNQLKSQLKGPNTANTSSLKEAANLTSRGREAFEKKAYYSSASYCFGANVKYSAILLSAKNLSKKQLLQEIGGIREDIDDFRIRIDNADKKTITDLEAYIVVKERLAEAEEFTNYAVEKLNKTNTTERAVEDIAYASERVNSARSWETFLGKKGKEFNLDKEILKKSCQTKISEADEREQYVELYFPNTLGGIKKDIERANSELQKGNYEICLSIASKAKADVDIILSIFGVEPDQYGSLIERKLDIVKNNIARQASKGVFPILGYSYYEYANSLKDSDVLSALLYSEYALELGNLDIYFRESNGKNPVMLDKKLFGIFLLGVLVGIAAACAVRQKSPAKKAKNKKRS